MKKRGLVVIYDPHALMQFLQFYCMKDHAEIQWDALCLPKENGRQEMDTFCEKTGIFNKIYSSDIEFMNLPVIKKIGLFFPMFFYAISGKQKKFVVKICNTMVDDIEAYDYYAANSESGFMAGMMASFASEKTTVYFEDGSADYVIARKKNQSYFKKGSFMNFQCVLMSKMGYCGKGYTHFEPTKNCYKYASVPEELLYKYYKEINRFHFTPDQNAKYKAILKKMYPELELYEHINSDCNLVFTIPVTSRNQFADEYIEKYQKYIDAHATEIYLKRHPRDKREFSFDDKLTVHEIPQDIPAEVIFPYFARCKCYMMEPDSLILNMSQHNMSVVVLYFDKYSIEESNLFNNWKNKDSFKAYCERFIKGNYQIIDL